MALVKLGSGSNLLGYYMYHGGTNPEGRLNTLNECQTSPGTANNDLPVCTYDFQAPLGEFGQPYPQYYTLRPLHLFMHDYGEMLAPMEASFPVSQDIQQGDDSHLRWSYRGTFVFINNYERFAGLSAKKGVQFEVGEVRFPRKPITIPSGTMTIFPVNLPVGTRLINWATAQPVARRQGKMWFEQKAGIAATFCIDGKIRALKKTSATKPFTTIDGTELYLITTEQAEHLFLREEQKKPDDAENVSFTKVKDAGPLRTIRKGRAKVAEAPTESDWQQAAVYRISIPIAHEVPRAPLLSITYRGDCARLYADGRLLADNFYYGRPFLYGLWRLPNDCHELELRILPLQEDAPIYLPREADKRAGEECSSIVLRSRSS